MEVDMVVLNSIFNITTNIYPAGETDSGLISSRWASLNYSYCAVA